MSASHPGRQINTIKDTIVTMGSYYPPRETERLQRLHSLQILDSEPEDVFDDLMAQARTEFNVPLALISLVDEHRQWFKSHCGIATRETPRDVSFCTHTILSEEVMVIPDAQKDTRFFNNPLVKGEPHIRFYAGAPIVVPDGLVLGTVCVIDTSPRTEFGANEIRRLAGYAQTVSAEIQKKAGR